MGVSMREERLDQGLMAVPHGTAACGGKKSLSFPVFEECSHWTLETLLCTSENLMTERLGEFFKTIRKGCLVIILTFLCRNYSLLRQAANVHKQKHSYHTAFTNVLKQRSISTTALISDFNGINHMLQVYM